MQHVWIVAVVHHEEMGQFFTEVYDDMDEALGRMADIVFEDDEDGWESYSEDPLEALQDMSDETGVGLTQSGSGEHFRGIAADVDADVRVYVRKAKVE